MSVLDVGCGTGAITSGIARAVAPGFVVGLDRDESLLAIARQQQAIDNLRFESGDILDFKLAEQFDIVTASRTLQWVADPSAAIMAMRRALKPHGRLVVLDYVHLDNTWDPAPPEAFKRFYAAFLGWRAANGWDNQIGDRLAALAAEAGFDDVAVSTADEVTSRGDTAFDSAVEVWLNVIQSIGPQVVASGEILESERRAAEQDYQAFIAARIDRQCLSMRCLVAS
jgi:SAM-dependent methyltransferase